MEWNEQREKQILKKSKWILTQRIIRIIALLFFVYIIYQLMLTLTIDEFGSKYEDAYYTKVALSLKEPNVYGLYDLESEEVTSFGTQKFSYHVMKRVGDNEEIFGTIDITKTLLPSYSRIAANHPGKESLSHFTFHLPEDPITENKLEGNNDPTVWERLERLPEGTVGELKFSTTSYMEPEELIRLLKNYDLAILWMPLYTGEFIDFQPTSTGRSSNSISVGDGIGLAGGRSHGNEDDQPDFRSESVIFELNEESIELSKQWMLDNIEELLGKGQSYYENFLGLSYLQKRYDYLNKEGFVVYGAVVTGPVKELLKLRDEETIQDVQLGDVELWNWETE